MRRFRNGWLWVVLVLAVIPFIGTRDGAHAQTFPTATPAVVDLSGLAQQQQFGPTETPTRTPTPIGPVQLEANQNARVRAQPSTEAEVLGEIRPGEYYNVIRRYYRWIEFQFDAAPTRRGWVYDELIRFIGDESAIPSVDSLDATVEGAPDIDATSTALAITATPGGLLTATAQARSGAAPVAAGEIGIQTPDSANPNAPTATRVPEELLPTFTYPPGIIALAPTEAADLPTDTPEPTAQIVEAVPVIPPLTPIVALAGLGLIGFIISAFRR